jgi:hypothetical protein
MKTCFFGESFTSFESKKVSEYFQKQKQKQKLSECCFWWVFFEDKRTFLNWSDGIYFFADGKKVEFPF